MRIYKENWEEIDFETSYFGDIIRSRNSYILPLLNISISPVHQLSITQKGETYIDKSYWVFENIGSVVQTIYYPHFQYFKDEEINFINGNRFELYLLGSTLFKSKLQSRKGIYFEWEIRAENSFLQLLDNSQLSENLFIPFDTPKFKANIDLQETIHFMENNYLPSNLKQLIETDSSTIRKVYRTALQEPVYA